MPCDRPSSKKQLRWAFAAEERGELPRGTARRWARKYKRKKGGSFKGMILKSAVKVAEDLPTALATGATHVTIPIKKEVMPDFPIGIPLTLGFIGGLGGAAIGPLFAKEHEVRLPSGETITRTTWGDIGWAAGKGALTGTLIGGGLGLLAAIGHYLSNKLSKKKTVVYYTETNPPMVYPVSEPVR